MRRGSEVLWSPRSTRDLIDIWKYFARLGSPEFADALLTDIAAAVDRIAESPLAWQERSDLVRGVRGAPVHPYIIFYRIADGTPEIVRVLHERRNSPALL